MTDLVLRDIDPALAERLRALAQESGLDMHGTLARVLEAGLDRLEAGAREPRFDGGEADLLRSMIDALEQVPDDPGFALIGRGAEGGAPGDAGDGASGGRLF